MNDLAVISRVHSLIHVISCDERVNCLSGRTNNLITMDFIQSADHV